MDGWRYGRGGDGGDRKPSSLSEGSGDLDRGGLEFDVGWWLARFWSGSGEGLEAVVLCCSGLLFR